MSRLKFTNKAILGTLAGIVGADIVFGVSMPENYMPIALQEPDLFKLFGKSSEMIVLNNKPWNIEAKAHLLYGKVTPNKAMFLRNNGLLPEKIDIDNWELTIDGESIKEKKTYTLSELKSKFKHYTYQLTLEFGGNGRSEFNPPAKGNQWIIGAVSCANWTGVRLKDVLEDADIKDDAVYIGYHAIEGSINWAWKSICLDVPLDTNYFWGLLVISLII